MVNIQDLFDDAKCFDTIRDMRWPDGVTCPRCSSGSVIKNGRDDTQPLRRRDECRDCRQRFDNLTDTIFAGHHLPLSPRRSKKLGRQSLIDDGILKRLEIARWVAAESAA